jgi:hypothetical protein
MARYGYNQCDECGGVRVARSKLCANCLVKAYERVNLQIARADIRIVALEGALVKSNDAYKDVLKYGFKRNQENVKLQWRIKELEELMIRRL